MPQTIHYRAVFNVSPSQKYADNWDQLLHVVKRWVEGKVPTGDAYLGKPFFCGGTWQSADRAVRVQSARFVGAGSDASPEFWAVRMDEKCKEYPAVRTWRTDIGVVAMEGATKFQVSLTNSYLIRDGYIGEPLPTPMPSTPKIVKWLLDGRNWIGLVGHLRLNSDPVLLPSGALSKLKTVLSDPARTIPIVYISRSFPDRMIPVSHENVATLLAGNAVVVVAPDSEDSDREMEWTMPEGFRCWNGMVRVYMPSLRCDQVSDSKRHRYFSKDDIRRLGQQKVEEMLVAGLVRQSRMSQRAQICSIEDVRDRRRHHDIASVTREQVEGKWDEWLSEYEKLLKEKDEQGKNMEQLEARVEDLEASVVERDKEVGRLRHETEWARRECDEAKQENARIQERLAFFQSMDGPPDSLVGVIECIERMFPSRLVFTERAKDSADGYDGISPKTAWQVLKQMATHLYALYFGDETGVDIVKEFKQRTRFDISLCEGKQTRRDRKFMKLREIVYKGVPVSIEPHVGYGSKKGALLRVHYYASRADKVLVIGHCGDHLENYTSQSIH